MNKAQLCLQCGSIIRQAFTATRVVAYEVQPRRRHTAMRCRMARRALEDLAGGRVFTTRDRWDGARQLLAALRRMSFFPSPPTPRPIVWRPRLTERPRA